MAYSTGRRAAVLKKLKPPNAVPLRQLAEDEGISEATLHTRRWDARSKALTQHLCHEPPLRVVRPRYGAAGAGF